MGIFDVLVLFSIVFTFIGLLMSFWCLVEIKAMQKSTHQIQYVPADNEVVTSLTKEQKKDWYKEDFDNVL